MIDKWFIDDINKAAAGEGRVVVTDARKKGKFLLNYLPSQFVLLPVASSDLDEIKAKYEAETHHAGEKVVFYTQRSKGELTFLLEYAETQGCIVLDDMETYIRKHLFDAIQINTQLPKAELLVAAKLSKGKSLNWWKGIAMGLNKPMETDKLLMDLLAAPASTAKNMDKDVWKIFTAEVFAMIGKPQTEQPAEVLAQTVMDAIFDGLVSNQISASLLSIYHRCTSRHDMDAMMADYIARYTRLKEADPLKAHPDHPFLALDHALFKRLSHAIENGEFLAGYTQYIDARIQSRQAVSYKAAWLHDEKWLRPFQYLYEQAEKELLDKWFALAKDYQPSQQGLLKEKLSGKGRIAILVCDGLRLEIAETIYQQAKSKKSNDYAFAMLPSVTENGMSALFGCEGVELSAQARYAHLKTQVPDVEVIQADKLNSSITAQHLVLMYGDIDQVGEKKQLAALKDINNYEKEIAEKIDSLLDMGYAKVYVTADHGFVITGILDEADKIPAPHGDIQKLDERFCLASDQLTPSSVNLIARQDDFCGSAYQYYAQTDKPFVTKGTYGYAHGGFTPQECIIPIYEFGKDAGVEALQVNIANKKELQHVAGQYFKLKIQAESSSDVFKQERRIELHLYEGSQEKSMQIVTIKSGQLLDNNEFEMPSSGNIKVVLVDAATKEQIDFCEVKSASSRDLDDLF